MHGPPYMDDILHYVSGINRKRCNNYIMKEHYKHEFIIHDLDGLSFISLNILLILCAAALMITPIFSVLLDIIVVVSCVPLIPGYLILLCCTAC